MRRITLTTLAILALTACYDFKGDRGRLGFATDATLDGGRPWTPEHALADGARPKLVVGEVIGTDEGPDGPTRFESSRSVELHPDEDGVYLEGQGRSWIGAEADGVRDDFRLEWREAFGGVAFDPLSAVIYGDPEPLDHVLLLEGGSTPLGYAVLDRRGRALGYVPDQLQIEADEGLEVATSEALVLRGLVPGRTELSVGWPGAHVTHITVDVLAASEVDGLTITALRRDGECALQATLESDGEAVRGGEGFLWDHHDKTDALAPCSEGARVAWGPHEATWRLSPQQDVE